MGGISPKGLLLGTAEARASEFGHASIKGAFNWEGAVGPMRLRADIYPRFNVAPQL
jgi:hypothetical protein